MVVMLRLLARFIGKVLVLALAAGIIMMCTDYIWAAMYGTVHLKENPLQRVGYYTTFSFALIFISGIFLLLIAHDWLATKRRYWNYINILLFLIIGIAIGLLTQGDGWALYLGPEKRMKHVISISLSLSLYPFISYYLDTRFRRRKQIAS